VLFSPLLYINHLIGRNDKLKRNIAILEKSAKHADKYLRDIYAEYISQPKPLNTDKSNKYKR